MNVRRGWLRIASGGCFLNAAMTGLLVILTAASGLVSVNAIVIPFMGGAALSFGLSLMMIRRSGESGDVMRNTLLAGLGVLMGSVAAVLGIAAYILLAGA